MKKKSLLVFLLMLIAIVTLSVGSVSAANTSFEAGTGSNKYMGNGHSHSYNKYFLDGVGQAYCIEASVNYKTGKDYQIMGEIYDPIYSWLIYNVPDQEDLQAAIWMVSGDTVTADQGGDVSYIEGLIARGRAEAGNRPVSASISTSGEFTYRRSDNTYVSPNIHVENGNNPRIEGAPGGSQLTGGGNDYQIVVPAANVTSDMDIRFVVDGSGSGWDYHAATVWGDGVNQRVVTGGRDPVSGDGASASIHLTARGDIKIRKLDEHGKPVIGTKFRVTGPHGYNQEVTVDADGYAYLYAEPDRGNVRVGDYTIVEIYVPANLVLDGTAHTGHVGSGSTLLWDFKQSNEYERGELSVKKEDVFKSLGKVNYGNGNFSGIEVGLYAAEDIYEGIKDANGNWIENTKTKVLSENELVATRVLNAAGEARSVKEFTRQDGKYFDGLPLGKYYWKEISTNEAYLMPSDATVLEAKKEKYEQTISYVNMNTPYVPNQSITILDQEVYTKVVVYKMDNDNSNTQGGNDTDKNPAEGAVLRLTLKSNYNETTRQPIDASHDTYTATVDEHGKAEFINPEFETLYANTGISMEYTIPYGTYVLDEIQTSNNGQSYYYGIQNVDVIAKEDNHTYSPIVMDEGIPFVLKLVKIDIDDDDDNGTTHEVVPIAGAKFKVWDLQAKDGEGDWLVQRMPNSEDTIDEFVTNNDGYCILPQKIFAGEYVVYETAAPEGYYVNEELKIPTKANGEVDKEKLGKEEFGGKYIDVRNVSVGVTDAQPYPENEGILDLDYIKDNLMFTVELGNHTTRGNIELYKTGEIFTDVKESTTSYEDDGYTDVNTEYEPVYKDKGLEGVKFEVTAVEDVKTSDGRLKEKAGTPHYITTGTDGHGICTKADGTEDELFCAKEGTTYHVVEIETPAGYKPCEPFDVVVYPGNDEEPVKIANKEANNEYIPINLKLDKNFVRTNEDDIMFKPANEYDMPPAVAIFGLYPEQDLVATNGKEIPKDTLIQTLRVVEGEGYIESYKLPDGDYYLEELYTSEPFTILDKDTREPHRYDFTVTHKKNVITEQDVVVTADNTYPTGDLYVVKISSTRALQSAGLTLKSTDEGYDEVRNFTEMYSEEITRQLMSGGMNVDAALANVLTAFDMKGFSILNPAKYGVYVDPECKIPLQQSSNGGESYTDVILTPAQDEEGNYTGAYSVKGIQEGTYYLKEIDSPSYMDRKGRIRKYDLSKDITVVNVTDNQVSNVESVVLRVLVDDIVHYEIQKTDVFTDEGIPDCLFTITDENGTELLRFVTNEEGEANIPTDIFEDGETYYFTELDAPKFPYYDGDVLYELNTEPHKFIAHVDDDGKWRMEYEDENGNVQDYEKVKIQNYRTTTGVELTKLDMVDSTPIPNCRFELKGIDTDFYETGVTDENGIYFFTDVPYGRYTYTELEAPEGWLIDTTPHEFTLDSHGTKIVVYDERKVDLPDTGDIAVVAIACVAVISVAGIVFLAIRKKKASSSK